MSFLARSPMRPHRLHKDSDIENPNPPPIDDPSDDDEQQQEEDEAEDVFNIRHKKPPLESLKKWRQATLVLNASRRFRYTLDLKRREQQGVNKIRASTHALVAVQRFKEAASKSDHDRPPPDGFGVAPERLVKMLQERNSGSSLQSLGGVEGVARALHTDPEKGIVEGEEELERRKQAFGSNTYPMKPGKSFFVFLWEACQDTTLIILMACAAVSLIVEMSIAKNRKEGWYDGTSIGCAVLVVILVTAYNDYKQSLQFRSLSEEKRNIQLQVVRGGRRFMTSIFTLVVGDLIPLNIGDQVPADGVLVKGHSLLIDESSMTGESEPVHVDSKHPFLLSGCKVVDGFGFMIVTGVGTNTEWGQVMATLDDDTAEETPLQVRLNGVATFIGKIGLSVALIVLIMLLIRYFVTEFRTGTKAERKASNVIPHIVDILSIAVTIVVVAVPEGLPLAVTLTLAYSMKKMMTDKSLVRHLAACETMGSATTICSDKTGTLTLNQMTVVRSCVGGEERSSDVSCEGELQQAIVEGIALNCSGSVFTPKNGGEPEVTGSPTEKAILSFGLKNGMDFDALRSRCKTLHVETFNSTKKRAGVAFKRESGEVFVHWKGAAEIIVDLCTEWAGIDGTANSLTQEKKDEIQGVIADMAASSLRCIALGYRLVPPGEVPKEEEWETWKIPDDGLILTAVVGIKDPCRPGVEEAVATCTKAGVKVRMVTGDNPLTARAIAKECGILTANGIVVEGKDFRSLTDAERRELVPKLDVMARSSPMDKLLLVQTLKQLNEVVAVTGDGTNDAPALHEADIGLSMGIAGTEVAKESSDIIILDDNFASVVKVVRWGRSVYANIQKFIQFQLTVNVVALTINFIAAASAAPEDVPLKAVQLLWVNLIMDTLGALALATEPPTDELMERPPVGRREALVTNVMWRNIFVQAAYQLVMLLVLFFGGDKVLRLKGTKDEKRILKNTIIFNAFVWCQLFNEINSRKPEKLNVFAGIHKNGLFCGVLVVTAGLQVIIVQFIQKFFKTTSLSWQYWLVCIALGVVSLPLGFLGKLIPVPKKPILTTHKTKRRASSSRHQELKATNES